MLCKVMLFQNLGYISLLLAAQVLLFNLFNFGSCLLHHIAAALSSSSRLSKLGSAHFLHSWCAVPAGFTTP